MGREILKEFVPTWSRNVDYSYYALDVESKTPMSHSYDNVQAQSIGSFEQINHEFEKDRVRSFPLINEVHTNVVSKSVDGVNENVGNSEIEEETIAFGCRTLEESK